MASSLCLVQDGSAVAVASGNGQNVTPNNLITLSLVDSVGVTAWMPKVLWTNGAVAEAVFSASSMTILQGPTWTATFVAPAEATGFEFYSEVIATSGVALPFYKFGIYCAGPGDAKVAFPADPGQRILAMQNPRFQPASELQVGPGAADPKAQAVVTSLAAYTGIGTGVLIGAANGVLAVQDGQTLTVGQIVHLPTGLVNVAAADAGPYVVLAIGGAGAKYSLGRPGWYAHASVAQAGLTFEVVAGTLFAGSTWKATAVGSVIGTTDAAFYPRSVTQQITLGATGFVVANVPILSATKTQFYFNPITPSGTAATVRYGLTAAPTPGALGVSTCNIGGLVAAGTINSADLSVGPMTITNQL